MRDDVKACVDARVNFFGTYYDVPADVKPEVDKFITDVIALGEKSADAASFEAEFATELSNTFNSLLPRCTPKAVQVSPEYQAYTAQVQQEFKDERKKQLADTIINDVGESVVMRAESDAISARNRAMSDAGVLDEYTKVSNVIDDSKTLFGKLFGRKKK